MKPFRKQKWIYIHIWMWLIISFLFWIHPHYLKCSSYILSSPWLKKPQTSQLFFLVIGLSLSSPVNESCQPSDPASFWEVLLLFVSCLGRDGWREVCWWTLSLWSQEERGKLRDPSAGTAELPCLALHAPLVPRSWGTWGVVFLGSLSWRLTLSFHCFSIIWNKSLWLIMICVRKSSDPAFGFPVVFSLLCIYCFLPRECCWLNFSVQNEVRFLGTWYY